MATSLFSECEIIKVSELQIQDIPIDKLQAVLVLSRKIGGGEMTYNMTTEEPTGTATIYAPPSPGYMNINLEELKIVFPGIAITLSPDNFYIAIAPEHEKLLSTIPNPKIFSHR